MLEQILSQLHPVQDRRKRLDLGNALFAVMPVGKIDHLLRSEVTNDNFVSIFEDWTAILDDWNRFDLSIPWYRDAFSRGVDPYLATEIICRVWEKQGGEQAIKACDELEPVIDATEFIKHGDAFHKEMVVKIFAGLRRVIAYEQGNDEGPSAVAFDLHDAVRGRIWERMWQLARLQHVSSIGRMAQLYPYIFDHDPLQIWHVVEHFLASYGYWHETITALDAAKVDTTTGLDVQCALLRWRVEALFQIGDCEGAHAAWESFDALIASVGSEQALCTTGVADLASNVLWSRYQHSAIGENLSDITNLRPVTIGHISKLRSVPDEATTLDAVRHSELLLAHIEEDLGNIEGATKLYLSSANYQPASYLPGSLWRASVFLTGIDHWAEAASIQTGGDKLIWPDYDTMSDLPIEERFEQNSLLPDKALMLNCEGIGDDLWRIIIALRFKGFDAPYAFVVDDRLQACMQRGLPDHEILVRSRGGGSHAVSVEIYHKDRIGLHSSVDSTRVTTKLYDKAKKYGEVCLGEDAYVQYFQRSGEFDVPYSGPILIASAAHRQKAENWLASLLPDRLNVGISWRTGVFHVIGSRNHYRIEELGEVLQLKGINWILLQYTVTPEEIAVAKDMFGAQLHMMPGIDLKNDIDQIVAITEQIDVMLASPSTIEPLAAAAGTDVITLGAGYYSVNQYRVQADGETDRVMPHIKLLTPKKYGNKEAILGEAARRLQKLAASKR